MKKIVILIVIVILSVLILTFNSDKSKIIRANIMYGTTKKCDEIEFATSDIKSRTCHICLKHFEGSSSQKICENCSKLTGRCSICGKIESENDKKIK